MKNIENEVKKPCGIIKLDKYTRRIEMPTLLLMNRSFSIIRNISRYENWEIRLVGNGIDEITFDVHKYANGIQCPVWDDLVDLKIVDVEDFGRFEITVDYTDNTETVKSVHGVSLEAELAQINLHEFHVNDEDAADMEITEYSKDNYDSEGNFIPTTFYREILPGDTPEEAEFKRKHSLLHRVLADKAPHWSIGYVTPYIALGEDVQPERSSEFQRTYTVDGDSIYDFLTGTVSEESNVIFVFDTINRKINCYSLCDCIDQETGKLMVDDNGNEVTGIGEDTLVFVSKRKLANEITISSNKDNIKNCFRIEGGDDVITDMVRAVNMNGSNYIYQFVDFQYNDMSESLREKIQEYQAMMSSQETQDEYYGNGEIIGKFLTGNFSIKVLSVIDAICILNLCQDNKVDTSNVMLDNFSSYPYWCYITIDENKKELHSSKTPIYPYEYRDSDISLNQMGIYTRLCNYYDVLAYLESSMMPNTDMAAEPGTAKDQYDKVVSELKKSPVAVSSMNNYNNNLFAGITNNIEAYAQVFLDTRFDLSVVDGSASYDSSTKTWTGKIQVVQHTDGKNIYPSDTSADTLFIPVKVNDDGLEFAKQKIYKKLSEGSMAGIDFKVAEMSETEMSKYFSKYSLNRLESFYDGYNSCLSVLMELGQTVTSDVQDTIYDTYYKRMKIVEEIKDARQAQVNEINTRISKTKKEQAEFQSGHDFQKALGDDYKEFCAYRREDTYTNSNYISDGLTDSECLAKAKELVEAASKEAKKACVLQRTVSVSLGNLFALPEFEKLWDSFALYNYIRVGTEDEVLKLRIIGIDFSGDSPEKIEVTFSDQIESVDGTIDDLRSIIKQASSMATSYPSTTLQAKQGSDAKSEITDMYTNGLNASKTMLTNNDNNEVTVNSSGILCKRMDDEGYYGDKQLRITGNIMALTDDGWKTVKMAVGESIFYNPFTQKYELKYGIQASVIVGELMCSENMFIGNKDGSVKITGDGIEISNGVIKSSDYDENDGTGSIIDLRDGTFSFASGGLKYGDDNELTVNGHIEATSIKADEVYSLYSRGKEIPVLCGVRDSSQTFTPIWSVKLQINDKAYINLKEASATGDFDKPEIDIKADTIRLLGNTYSQTGQIISSDRNAKDNIKPLTDKHMEFFSLLQPVSFTFIDGASGRTHIGFISQDVEDAMTKAGLTDLEFAGFCKKVKTAEVVDENGNKTFETEKDENGNPVYIYALRYEEFIALNTFMIQKLQREVHLLQNLRQDIKKIKETLGIKE